MAFPLAEISRHLVALLFAGGVPLEVEAAARVLEVSRQEIEDALRFLHDHPPLGLMIQRTGEQVELVSDPESASYIEKLLGLSRPVRLSRAALETLAIVAYRQPVTRGDVEAIRGVNSDSAITTILNRGLIAEVGRRESAGRPALYSTTSEFLQFLGIPNLDSLPPVQPRG